MWVYDRDMEYVSDRRRFIRWGAAGLAVGLAGCLGDGDDEGEPSGDDDTGNGGDTGNGDDGNGEAEIDEGALYAFAPNTIAVIDPDEGEVIEEITDGLSDEEWGDPQIAHDHSQLFVVRESPSQVLVIDTATHEIVSEVDIGPDPTHMYHPTDDEIWAHSDDEGTFYVIDSKSHDVIEIVESGLDAEGHGKLLYHEDLGGVGYATNVNDPGLPVMDLDAYERTDFVEFGEEGGTHYKAYGPQNGLVYGEFGDETVVVDSETDEVVDRLDFSGGMYLGPGEDLLGVLDGDTIRFLDVTDDEHEEVGTVELEDAGPDALRYHEAEDGTLYAITANTMNDRAPVIDVDEFEVVDELDVGDIVRPEGAPFLHRTGVIHDGQFATPADDGGTVSIVDVERREVVAEVEIEEGVDTVQFVGDSGTGYTGRIR